MSVFAEVLKGLVTGGLAGFVAGLLGVSPGGILVPVISLVLGLHQRLAQAVSLVAQAPPTSLSGVSSYTKSGRGASLGTVMLVSLGFVVGGPVGAAYAKRFNDHQLRCMFVAYLVLLVLLALIRGRRSAVASEQTELQQDNGTRCATTVLIGAIAGMSSGLLGIGGGLAITALSVLLLHIRQHEAQALSLIVTALPLTLPAAWMYVHQGTELPWRVIACVIVGLALGTKGGAMLANKLPERNLRVVFTCVILAMAIYMMVRA
jgi:uncharacterized protein